MSGPDVAKDFINKVRKEAGHRAAGKVKKGYRKDSLLCPIAEGLRICGVQRADYTGDTVILTDPNGRNRVYHEPEVAQWMEAYDNGEYPELVKPPTPLRVKLPGERKFTIIG